MTNCEFPENFIGQVKKNVHNGFVQTNLISPEKGISMKMKSKFVLAGSVVLMSSVSGFCNTGIFGTGVALSSNIGGNATFNLYEMTLLGDSRLAPDTGGGGVSLGAPTLVNTDNGSGISTWATVNEPSLGTFNPGDTLTLNGGEVLTYKNGGSDVTGADISYSVDNQTLTTQGLTFNQDNVPAGNLGGGNPGDQRWYSDGFGVNLLSGLSAGTHILGVRFRSSTDQGYKYMSNGGQGYNVFFTIAAVPEPSTLAIAGLSGLAALLVIRRRRL